METADAQDEVCRRVGVDADRPDPGSKLGISRNLRSDVVPLNGLRHPPSGDTSGWYLWRGEDLSQDPDFFVPLHIEHVADWCPDAIPYLALPPGWRFLRASDHEDIWFDPALLEA